MVIERMYNSARELRTSDIRCPYTLIGAKYQPDNYRIYDIGSLMKSGLRRGVDVSNFIYDFIGEQGEVLGISNIVSGRVLMTKFKALNEKKFLTYGPIRQIPYGLGLFDDNFYYGTPIVLVEGEKDQAGMSMCYPYVCAVGKSSTGVVMKQVLLSLTNRFILYYDADDPGRHACYRDRKFFRDHMCQVDIGIHPPDVKDSGTIIDYMFQGKEYDAEYIKSFYTLQLMTLTN